MVLMQTIRLFPRHSALKVPKQYFLDTFTYRYPHQTMNCLNNKTLKHSSYNSSHCCHSNQFYKTICNYKNNMYGLNNIQSNWIHTMTKSEELRILSKNAYILENPSHNLNLAMVIVSRKKHTHLYPPLIESDLEEQFTRGSGPGGQSVNRTMNKVVLKHLPTGIVVMNHETRSLETNRKRARQNLQQRLDFHYNGENAYIERQKRIEKLKYKTKKQKVKSKLEKLKEFKEREGLE
ncbi:unnamed protein product [Owenia fusiformis]|uniref:Prokaryotic-type class I peptide chain release factors domain-containing protein n=1 Tax=Owenia fusiformis TaxID=6347 RepID=A0A8S4Q6W5_OWEFU|nr:unnamed protein product [Owenia fusiformis]